MTVKESFINNRSASAIMNFSTANEFILPCPSCTRNGISGVYDGMNGGGVAIKPYIQNGMGINVNSKNPERALMFLDRDRNDERYVDLVTYGIEGVRRQKCQKRDGGRHQSLEDGLQSHRAGVHR